MSLALAATVMAALAAPPVRAEPDETEIMTALQNRIERVAEEVGRSVVSIQVKGPAPRRIGGFDGGIPWDMLPPEFRRFFDAPGDGGGEDDSPRNFRRFFRDRPGRPRSERPEPDDRDELVPRGLGSGVVISRDGYVVTNQHVVDEAKEIEVTLSDKRKFKAEVVGEDVRRDLAVLKVDASDLPAARLHAGAEVRRGMFVLAIGNPFGFGAEGQASVSFGIVSGTRRSLSLGLDQDRYYGKLIQSDAAINPGNSGGALSDLQGRVIGVNVAIASRSGGSQGVGFAIPIDEDTLELIERLKRGESVAYGFLGVGIRNPTVEESEAAGAPSSAGAFVVRVEPGSPADEAGLRPADLIVALNGKRLRDADDLVTEVGGTPPGRKVKLTLYRSGKKMALEAEVVRRGGDRVASRDSDDGEDEAADGDAVRWRGMTVRELTAERRREARLGKDASGVFVDKVDKDSPAYAAGIRAGDVIDQVGSRKVAGLEDFKRGTEKLEGRAFVNVVGRGPELVGQ
jgi:serine protease Do